MRGILDIYLRAEQQSGPLANSDIDIVKRWVTTIAITWLFYGVDATLLLVAAFLLFFKQIKSTRAQLSLFGLLILIFVLFTAFISMTTAFILNDIMTAAYNPPNNFDLLRGLRIATVFMQRTIYLVSDGIVVWRAWIMFPFHFLVRSVLAVCIAGSFVGTFVYLGMTAARYHRDINDEGDRVDILIMAIPLLVTNAIATGLIGYKAWIHHQDIKGNLLLIGSSVSRVEKVLLLLVESGVIYCALWITYILIAILYTANSVPGQVYPAVMSSLSVLYPVFVILIVAFEKSREESRAINNFSLSQSLRFASVLDMTAAAIEMQQEESVDQEGYRERRTSK
ncbi:hypothetical protein D9758_007033 [Tetrapyrgos nigripes]|uniref:Uncharacterized protein n=1 Tax=Tetrapyrgos nigripes TaxID=182062 RepID=A0A8H5LMN4_9AGAR|nr:hypothetical protein D9758_007033 [Tetrapyrgos nigripes]